MENNIKLEDTCLTVEQAKELQALGIDMKGSLMVYCDFNDQVHEYELLANNNPQLFGPCEVVNTLTNTEMLEMLPYKYEYKEDEFFSEIERNKDMNFIVFYGRDNIDLEGPCYHSKLLRDCLFNMIKFLKTNKII